MEDSLAFLDDNEHLEEMDKLSDALRSMKQEKANGITKRNADLCDTSSSCKHMLLNPGKFITKGTAKAYHPAYNKHYFQTYFTYHGSLTTPGNIRLSKNNKNGFIPEYHGLKIYL